MDPDEAKDREPKVAGRVVRIGLLIFCVAVIGILVSAWLIGDQGNLPFDYEGFD